MRVLVLFTRDLRVHDHPALTEACSVADQVVPAFVLDDGLLRVSPNRSRFLLQCLVDLDRNLRRIGGRLYVRRGEAVTGGVDLARELSCEAVFLTSDVTELARARETKLREGLASAGVELRVFPGNAAIEPGAVAPEGKDVYRVFSPYWRAWAGIPKRAVLPAPANVPVPGDVLPGPFVDPGSVTPESIDLPPGGETPGRRCLNSYLTNEVANYAQLRNELAADETSRLSPYLRFGCISANDVVRRAAEIPGAEEFVRQLCWRDFFGQLLDHDPALQWRDFRPGPGVAPVEVEGAFEAWSEGRTGLPLVDAAMRQLRREGWMHNRARMVAGSFLTRRLGVPWQEGARHFFRWLIDGDPANNSGGWQWVAGTGTDPRRSRSFNPVRQARKYDPTGEYVRRYVHELADAPDSAVFTPWKDPDFLHRSGYPEPILAVPTS